MNTSKVEKKLLKDGVPPKFIVPLEDMVVLVGSSINLDCKVTGEPMPQVKWTKDGELLWDDVRYQWKNDPNAGLYHLSITNATVQDEGTYRL